jgi:hypothetical protein
VQFFRGEMFKSGIRETPMSAFPSTTFTATPE